MFLIGKPYLFTFLNIYYFAYSKLRVFIPLYYHKIFKMAFWKKNKKLYKTTGLYAEDNQEYYFFIKYFNLIDPEKENNLKQQYERRVKTANQNNRSTISWDFYLPEVGDLPLNEQYKLVLEEIIHEVKDCFTKNRDRMHACYLSAKYVVKDRSTQAGKKGKCDDHDEVLQLWLKIKKAFENRLNPKPKPRQQRRQTCKDV